MSEPVLKMRHFVNDSSTSFKLLQSMLMCANIKELQHIIKTNHSSIQHTCNEISRYINAPYF